MIGYKKTLEEGIPDKYLSEDTILKLAEKMVDSKVMNLDVEKSL